MYDTGLQGASLDVPTLCFAAVCIAAMLGLFLIFAWLQQRSVRALAWWGSAYLIGASSMALWSAPPHVFRVPSEIPAALIFIACGMIWNGVRLFQGRSPWGLAAFAGALVWLTATRFSVFPPDSTARVVLSAIIIAVYTFSIACELWRERRKTAFSRSAAVVVPCLHAGIFLAPLAMHAFLPELPEKSWLTVFALETMIYAVGTAFIVMVMVKDHHVHVYRSAATIDPLTGLLNRRAFNEGALSLCAHQAAKHRPVSLLMFDLDHFKSINDRFGHAVGDATLQTFAEAARASMRADDILARRGGEEFTAIIPADIEVATRIGERVRAAFESAGAVIAGFEMNATVSVGVAACADPVTDLDALMERADAALYRAKHEGRNRVYAADDKLEGEAAHLIASAQRHANEERFSPLLRENQHAA
jgi:diguanylate cyclase (GGDEF)-like protein